MKKNVKQIKTSKYIIGLNGATTYVYDSNEQLIKVLKDIKSVYNAYVSNDEKVLCLKSTDTYLAFYNMQTLELLNKISFKKCSQPQDQESTFDNCNNFVNLQYTDRLTCDIVVYDGKNFTEKQRYIYNLGIVLQCIDIIDNQIYIVGFIRPNKENFSKNEIKKYIFKFEEGQLNGFEISEKDHFVYSSLRRKIYSIDNAKDIEYIMLKYNFTKDELINCDVSNLKSLWDKYENKGNILIEKPINL